MDSPLQVAPSDQARSAFGALLRQARERRGLTLEQIARETKIPWRHLDALEHGNFDAVPRGPYRRFETRAFAQTVGLDQDLALAELDRALEPSVAGVVAEQPKARPSHLRQRVVTVIAPMAIVSFATAAAVSGFAVWVVRGGGGSVTSLPDLPAPPALVAQPTASPRELAPAVVTQQASDSVAATANADGDHAIADHGLSEGELVVTTEPPGARVTVDGVGWGVTPLTIRHLSFGTKRVRLTKEGYVGEEHGVRVDEKRPQAMLEITLRTP